MFAQHPPRTSATTTACILFHLLLTIFPQTMHCRPGYGYTTDGTELFVLKEIVRCTRQGLHELCQNGTATTIDDEQQQQQRATNVANESVMDVVDDLILLERKTPQQQQQQRKTNHPYDTYQQQSELLSSAAAREDSIVSAAAAAPAIGDPSDSTALGSSYQQEPFSSDSDGEAVDDASHVRHPTDIKTTDVDAVNAAAADEIIADGVLFHGVLLRLADGPHSVPQTVPPIDMSDFVSLIPADEVKSIATNYYNNDAEVRRAYAYLSGPDFVALRQHIVASAEVGAFLQYLNVSGFDVLKFVAAVANLTKVEGNADSAMDGSRSSEFEAQQRQLATKHNNAAVLVVNEISRMEPNASPSTQSPTIILEEAMSIVSTKASLTAENFDEPVTQKTEQLNGLHGLVDSILEILPQDQILATFFDKLESDENFRKFVNNIQRPAFAQILSKMEQSMSLRNLIFTLHNNGIYIARIVDSLKAYFFLGGFS